MIEVGAFEVVQQGSGRDSEVRAAPTARNDWNAKSSNLSWASIGSQKRLVSRVIPWNQQWLRGLIPSWECIWSASDWRWTDNGFNSL